MRRVARPNPLDLSPTPSGNPARTGSLPKAVAFIALLSAALLPAVASAGALSWDGTLVVILEDSGTGTYTGGIPNTSPFSGQLFSPDTCGATCTVEPFPPFATHYVFSNGGGEIAGLGATTTGAESSIEVINDESVNQDAVDLAAVLGLTLTLGQTVDIWSFGSENALEFTPDFVDWGVAYIYATTNPFSDTSFTSAPPPNPDLVIWEINEDNENVYSGVGLVNTVPEPAAALQVAAGAIFLLMAARLRRHEHDCASTPYTA